MVFGKGFLIFYFPLKRRFDRKVPKGYLSFQDLQQDPKVDFISIHTSGHAILEDLKKYATAFAPKHLVPIHTEMASQYEDYFDNVLQLDDGDVFDLS